MAYTIPNVLAADFDVFAESPVIVTAIHMYVPDNYLNILMYLPEGVLAVYFNVEPDA